ncbi:MAG: hypothetical protein ILP10_02735, partial [Lachnospiraceae bacterium]|nr:hypothetical protein [Lachnospiraceae bacterium]
ISGDLFHRQPIISELKEADSAFGRLEKTRVVIIGGNHDYVVPGSALDRFEWRDNVSFIKSAEPERLRFDDLGVDVVGFSYHSRRESGEKAARLFESRLTGSHDRMPGDADACEEGARTILMLHGGTADASPFDRRALSKAPFSYVALGHIHLREEISKKAHLPGSPEPLDRTETGEHGVICGTISEDGEVSTRFVPLASRRYREETVETEPGDTGVTLASKLKACMSSHDAEDIYSFRLTGFLDPDIELDRDALMTLGNIACIEDETTPDYDFEELYRENRDNIIRLYIDRMRNSGLPDEVADRALYLGVEALIANSRR